jgi:Mn-dependent DtxR family transcriptional regulator
MPKPPQPSGSAKQLKEYLEIIANAQESQQGAARRWDIYKRAMNETQTDRWVAYLIDRGLMVGDNTNGYKLTPKGIIWLDLLREHADLVGALTQELYGNRMRRLDR